MRITLVFDDCIYPEPKAKNDIGKSAARASGLAHECEGMQKVHGILLEPIMEKVQRKTQKSTKAENPCSYTTNVCTENKKKTPIQWLRWSASQSWNVQCCLSWWLESVCPFAARAMHFHEWRQPNIVSAAAAAAAVAQKNTHKTISHIGKFSHIAKHMLNGGAMVLFFSL